VISKQTSDNLFALYSLVSYVFIYLFIYLFVFYFYLFIFWFYFFFFLFNFLLISSLLLIVITVIAFHHQGASEWKILRLQNQLLSRLILTGWRTH